MECRRCGSMAINPNHHGRLPGADLDLCDVCYWRKRCFDVTAEMRSDIILTIAKIMSQEKSSNPPGWVTYSKALQHIRYVLRNTNEQ